MLSMCRWRTKQNLDYTYSMMYARSRGTYYVQVLKHCVWAPKFIRHTLSLSRKSSLSTSLTEITTPLHRFFQLFLLVIYAVSRKKEIKMFLVMSPMKLRRCWRNLVHHFLNRFAAKWCKYFPPHLNSVCKLPCETWNAHCTLSCYRKKL